jgi:uncharacterized LabA/DUF88 family protein
MVLCKIIIWLLAIKLLPVDSFYLTKVSNKILRSSLADVAVGDASPLPGVTESIDRSSRVMLFIDGTWLYYSLLRGRGKMCPVKQRYGDRWLNDRRVDWNQVPYIVGQELTRQLTNKKMHHCFADVTRTYVFTSTRADTTDDIRLEMVRDWYKANFDVTHLETLGDTEKCVDISLAVEMLYMSEAYDTAVVVTGDKDFLPALQKTRMKGKNVAICSMRNSCNAALYDPQEKCKDFDMIWLEDHLEELLVERYPETLADELLHIIRGELLGAHGKLSSRDLGRALQTYSIGGQNMLKVLKDKYRSLKIFLEGQRDHFGMDFPPEIHPEFIVCAKMKTSLSDTSQNEDSNTVYILSQKTVVELKQLLRDLGLPVSGSKSELVSRLASSGIGFDTDNESIGDTESERANKGGFVSTVTYNKELEVELLKIMVGSIEGSSDDLVSSRTLGLMLQNSVVNGENALVVLKRQWGGLKAFVQKYRDLFELFDDYDGDDVTGYSKSVFGVRLK